MEHYYSEKQTSKLKIFKINECLRDINIELYSASGIFSSKKVDKGTALLINNAIIKPNWKILDLGCGCGVVGITFAKLFPKSTITMSDINKRAVKISKMNIALHNLTNAAIKQSDLFENITDKFDTILCNPPYTAGRKICFDIISQSKPHLKKGGLLQLVARHNKGGKELSKEMNQIFGNVRDIAKGSGYRVYISEN